MFFKRSTGPVDWIIAGLGNPGKKYEGTRHNAGFDALDFAASAWNIDVRRLKYDALSGIGQVAGSRVLLLKPQTFMNLSGKSLLEATEFYKVPPQRVLVLHDDVSLAPGMLRIRLSGSAGGHNGLKSIITFLGQDFPRIKIGVGDKPRPEYDMADWVLSRFTPEENKLISARYKDITTACELLVQGKSSEAMNRCNTAPKAPAPPTGQA